MAIPQDQKDLQSAQNPVAPISAAKAEPVIKPTTGTAAPAQAPANAEMGADADGIVDANVMGDASAEGLEVAAADAVEAVEEEGLSGLFGGLAAGVGGAAGLTAAGGAVGLAALASGGSSSDESGADASGGGSAPTGTPLDAILGPLQDAVGGGDSGGGGPTGTPLDAVLGPVADAAGGGGDSGGGGPTGTPLDAVLGPVADAAGGGGDSGGGGPTGTPLDAVLGPVADAAGGGGDAPTFSAGAEMLTSALPLEQIPEAGTMIESAIIDGASQLDAAIGGGAAPASVDPLDAAIQAAEGGLLGSPPQGLPTDFGGDLLTSVTSGISSVSGGADAPVLPPSNLG